MQPDIIICLGKMLLNNRPDWILESRLKKTAELARKYPFIPVVLTGGQSNLLKNKKTITEAEAMQEYILKIQPDLAKRIVLENKGTSTLDQLRIILKTFLNSGKYKNIGLVTDEIHMSRAQETAEHIFGGHYKILPFSAEVRISGRYRMAMEFMEQYFKKTLKRTKFSRTDWPEHIEEWSNNSRK